MSEVKILNLHQKLSELSVLDFLELFQPSKVCVDFAAQPVGKLNVPFLDVDGVQFIVPGGEIYHGIVGADPVPRNYLALFGTGNIWITLPRLASRIDVFVANVGGDPINGTFYSGGATFQVAPDNVVQTYTCSTSDLSKVLLAIQTAECLVWRVCYVPQ